MPWLHYVLPPFLFWPEIHCWDGRRNGPNQPWNNNLNYYHLLPPYSWLKCTLMCPGYWMCSHRRLHANADWTEMYGPCDGQLGLVNEVYDLLTLCVALILMPPLPHPLQSCERRTRCMRMLRVRTSMPLFQVCVCVCGCGSVCVCVWVCGWLRRLWFCSLQTLL